MLTELYIEDFAIIDKLDLSFEPGLITFTGETGAGKSIIIDAVETLLGGRADSTMIRTGAKFASLEGVFLIPEKTRDAVHEILNKEDLQDDPDYLTLNRDIRQTGRNVARINGHITTAGLLRQIGEFLIDIHGQSEHLSLLRVSQHLELLDRFASSEPQNRIQEKLSSYRSSFRRLYNLVKELDEIRQAERDAARLSDILNYQIEEIEAAQLTLIEENDLKEERNRLANAEALATLAQEILLALDEGTPEAPATTDLLGQAINTTSELAQLDPSQTALKEQAQTLFENATDLSLQTRSYLGSIEFNSKRLNQVEERLSLIDNLKRKYGDSIQAVLDFAENAKNQLDQITNAEERIQLLEAEQIELLLTIGRVGQKISHIRHAAAQKLEKILESELADLHMKGARLKVEFIQKADPSGVELEDGLRVAFYANGLEQVEFLIETNPGEGYKPLVKIASGGETSRLMLALKYVLAQADYIPTLIFDEIDQGIGGRAGGIVGRKLWELSRQHQVLCVTHLPQLAAYSGQHFHVEKDLQADRTITKVTQVQGQERVLELAHMLGSVSEGTLKSAQELIQSVEN